MSPPRMRPVFEIPVPGDGRAVLAGLRRHLESPDCPVIGQVRDRHAFLRMPEGERNLLSPHLELELREAPEGTMLHGRFSPRPNVWMGFMALFLVLGILGLSGMIWAAAQAMLGGPVWTLWSGPVSLALIAFIYGAAFIGQGLRADEMYRLRVFVDETVRGAAGDS